MPYKDKNKQVEYSRIYRLEHKQELRNKKHLYTMAHKEQRRAYLASHKEQSRNSQRLYSLKHIDKRRKYTKQYELCLKLKVLTYYGNGKCVCVRCGFDDIRTLSIDHINGGGTKHVSKINMNLYLWLINNNYPDGFQTLCMNCQWIKKFDNNEMANRVQDKLIIKDDINNKEKQLVLV